MENIIIGADHRGFTLKEKLKVLLSKNYNIIDVGTGSEASVDYPDIAEALAKAIQTGAAKKGILICGSGVGACVAANKFKGIRAAICHDVFSSHQGVEDDDMNVLCLGGGIVGESLAVEIINSFLAAKFIPEERYVRRLEKVKKIEDSQRN
ncbi:MAG TPA: ribose 5-phosphate isomerase B [Ignavibacteria bacterium]|nr:ribose 5-phosphate isomerase B [Bacteroidota bacterium]HRE09756.1 ribose 5-phosphate isomerase B [Ignavibacteria bacterium]HRF65518.1 ribose 5-phosphate isomerase B [Ignavibacteria bacterium]HRJ02987.1 ribose 5-phosphate isomerase B [Ignavibacteria bacterium]